MGILSKFPIQSIRSHVHERRADFPDDPIFSRDCPEYDIELPSGETIVILPNHFKSKRNGDDEYSKTLRTEQAISAHKIAVTAKNRSPYVLIAGDLNDTPDSEPLESLFTGGFKDVMSHPSYPTDRPGTFGTGLKNNKIDYLIMSSKLRTKLKATGIERRGSYHPNTWTPFDTVTKPSEEASDHHLVWADFDL